MYPKHQRWAGGLQSYISSLMTCHYAPYDFMLREPGTLKMIGGNYKIQKTTFSDGTTVSVDFDNQEYIIQ